MPIEQPGRIRGKQIGDGEISSRLIDTTIQSDNYVQGFSGWLISRVTGNVEFNEGAFRGDVAISGNLEVSGENGILIKDGGDLRVESGGDIVIAGGQLVAGPTTVNASGVTVGPTTLSSTGVQVGSNVLVNSTGLHVIGGLVTPLWTGGERQQNQNVSLTTTLTAHASVDLTPPDWVERVLVLASMAFQMTNSSSDKNMRFRIDIEGAPGTGAFSHGVSATSQTTQHVSHTRSVELVTWTNPITVQAIAAVNTGSNSTNDIRIDAFAFGLRN